MSILFPQPLTLRLFHSTDIHAPHTRPLFQILPGELSFPFRLELIEKRLGIMVIHELKPLACVERLEGLEDQGMAFAWRNLAHVDGCLDNSVLLISLVHSI